MVILSINACVIHLSQIYRAFGLGSSYAKVLKFDFLLQMAECKTAGREHPDVPHRLLGDIWQVRHWNLPPPQAFVRPKGGVRLLSLWTYVCC